MYLALKFAYLGTGFAGFQKQPDNLTIEETIEHALLKSKIGLLPLSEGRNLIYASRTDKDVNAYDQTIKIHVADIPERLLQRINHYLPKGIYCWAYAKVDEKFSPRYDAIRKTYCYLYLSVNESLNISKMIKATNILVGTHDFRNFAKKDPNVTNYTRRLERIDIERKELFDGHSLISFRITGQSFLWQMVRRLVGHLLEVAKGIKEISDTKKLIDCRTDRFLKKPLPMPPSNLILEKIEYSDSIQWNIDISNLKKIQQDFNLMVRNRLESFLTLNHFLDHTNSLLLD